jgi:hypothetical protein
VALRQRIWIGLLLATLAMTGGCGGAQDPDQPAVGSISVKAAREDDTPSLTPGKIKTAPADRK